MIKSFRTYRTPCFCKISMKTKRDNKVASWLKCSMLSIFILLIFTLILSIWLTFLRSFQVIFGAVYLLFLPGFVWSWVIWKENKLDNLERSILSLVISISLVPLVVLFLNKLGIRINPVNSTIEVFGVIILGGLALFIRNRMRVAKLKT